MLLGILLAFLILVCIALGGVVLLQRSEGGALGMGGSPGGFMTARGAGDLLTRTTWVLAAIFFTLCLGLTIIQGRLHKGASVVERLRIDPLAADTKPAPVPVAPVGAPTAPAQDGFGAPLPEVHTAPAATKHGASTPPDTNTGPTDPVAKTVGGTPSPAPNTPGPRTR